MKKSNSCSKSDTALKKMLSQILLSCFYSNSTVIFSPKCSQKGFSVKICKFPSLCGNIHSSSCVMFGVLSPKLLLFHSNSIRKIMEWRLAVDAAAVDNSNDSGRN